jgi:spore coat polysaccharide biosynthesis protein SpsF
MLTTTGIIDLTNWPAGSKNNPRELARRSLAGQPLLTWIVRRVTEAQQLDSVVVLLASGPDWDDLVALVPRDVDVFESEATDALGRLSLVGRRVSSAAIVRVEVDCPLIDPVLIDRLVIAAARPPECDYASYCSEDGRPAMLSMVGLYAEWCRCQALDRAHETCTEQRYRKHGTSCLYSQPEQYRVRMLPVPEKLNRDDVQLTLQERDDWEHLEAIVEALGPDRLDWHEIVDLLDRHPSFFQRSDQPNRTASGV